MWLDGWLDLDWLCHSYVSAIYNRKRNTYEGKNMKKIARKSNVGVCVTFFLRRVFLFAPTVTQRFICRHFWPGATCVVVYTTIFFFTCFFFLLSALFFVECLHVWSASSQFNSQVCISLYPFFQAGGGGDALECNIAKPPPPPLILLSFG